MNSYPTSCTACGAAVAEDADGRLPPQCPACGEMLVVDDELDESPAAAEEECEEVEEARIRRIVRERRAQVRTRSYYVVVMLACVIFAVKLGARLAESGKSTETIGYGAGAILLLMIAWAMVRRYREMSSKMSESALSQPATPPDFSGLSDGSQHAENLKNLGPSQ